VSESSRPGVPDEHRLRIVHVGLSGLADTVNGATVSAWSLMAQQAPRHDLTVIARDVALARRHGEGFLLNYRLRGHDIKLLTFSSRRSAARLPRRIIEMRPDLVHFHSAGHPYHAWISASLRRHAVPYVVKPGGALAPPLLRRGRRLTKTAFKHLGHKQHLAGAKGVVAVSPRETDRIGAYLSTKGARVHLIRNPVDERLFDLELSFPSGRTNVVYLGRFDVHHKGLDFMVAMAQSTPEAEFHLYGDGNDDALMDERGSPLALPENINVHGPVFGAAKAHVFSGASIYLQTSRWEAFGMSIAEAMASGTPPVVRETADLADELEAAKAGVILPSDPRQAADVLRRALSDQRELVVIARRARDYAREHFHPIKISHSYECLYRQVLND
jgi:glycosyltransferase involved in cell wall biosynthesis